MINDAFVEFGKLITPDTRAQIIWAEVKDVDWNAKTMTATGQTDGLDYYDVKLGLGGQYVKPKQGSKVLLAVIDGHNMQTILLHADEPEEIIIRVGELEMETKQNKWRLENGSQNLKQVLNNLIDRLKQAIIQTPAGPGNFSPADVTALEQIKQNLNQLLA